MRFSLFLTCAALAVGINALALPKVTLEGENGIIGSSLILPDYSEEMTSF